MADLPLAGARVAVLVESQYIPDEIRAYQHLLGQRGASVDLVSRLWDRSSLQFYSTVEPRDGVVPSIEWLEVSLDVDHIDLDDYDAVIASANYTSVRLRYVEPPESADAAADAVRDAPAARFLRRALLDPRIVVAAPCHALWLLTPSPEVLVGRRVTCNTVVLADVLNAGAVYVPPAPGSDPERHVVVDHDLVTSTSWFATPRLVDEIERLIVAKRSMGAGRVAGAVVGAVAGAVASVTRASGVPSGGEG